MFRLDSGRKRCTNYLLIIARVILKAGCIGLKNPSSGLRSAIFTPQEESFFGLKSGRPQNDTGHYLLREDMSHAGAENRPDRELWRGPNANVFVGCSSHFEMRFAR